METDKFVSPAYDVIEIINLSETGDLTFRTNSKTKL